MCQKVYFPTEPFGLADYLSMHACMYDVCIFAEDANTEDNSLSKSHFRSLKMVCLANITLATSDLRLDLVSTNNTIQALLLTVCSPLV